jgi:hypothetical protein
MNKEETMIEMMDDEEFYNYKKNLIKESFTEDDYLSCDKTRQILEDDFFWRWERKGEPCVEDFYNGIRKETQGKFSTPLFYDTTGEFSSKLTGIVYKYLKREYDISIFHDCPSLADPLVRKYDEIQENKKIRNTISHKLNEGVNIKTTNKFDWSTKTYK